ncbi:hypothetical protein HMPREF9162_1208 [Selenomonas sp. oral taxon 137 str. F0430]|nr:hypothetical protein HMPREF9162_1208 [Selenomonas sp. oral taxon 137 str. F0430]
MNNFPDIFNDMCESSCMDSITTNGSDIQYISNPFQYNFVNTHA